MRNLIMCLLLVVGFIVSSYTPERITKQVDITCDSISFNKVDTLVVPTARREFNLQLVKRKLARLESGHLDNPYTVVNRYGYMGKYQFGRRTLEGLIRSGDLVATQAELDRFIDSPILQERAMTALLKHNKRILKRYGLEKYVGKKIRGVTVTMEGLLAGAHLVGPYAVNHFVKSGGSLQSVTVNNVRVSKIDGNGTSVLDYLKQFSV